MQVVFRVDASVLIGHGHVMRCLALAGALRERGARVCFLCRDVEGHAIPVIQEKGFEVRALECRHRSPSPQEDASASLAQLDLGSDVLVVDHYALDASWESKMRGAARRMMVIDDLANRPHDCDLLLDQNLLPDGASRYHGKVPAQCRLMLGVDYVLLDPVYHETSKRCAVREEVRHILVFFGGGDAGNMTCRALRELAGQGMTGDVVIGAVHPHREEVRALCSANGWQLHIQTDRMAELIARADLAIGAGGCSQWERSVLGLPAIVITIAENQHATTRMLAERGACRYLGPAVKLPDGAIRAAVESFRTTSANLQSMSRAAFDVVPDGKGCYRVAQTMEEILQCATTE